MVDEDIKMKRQLAGWNMAAVIAPTAGNNLKCQGRLHYKVVPLVPVFSFHVCCYVCVYTFLSRTFFFYFFFIFTPFSCRPLARSYRCVNAWKWWWVPSSLAEFFFVFQSALCKSGCLISKVHSTHTRNYYSLFFVFSFSPFGAGANHFSLDIRFVYLSLPIRIFCC